MSGAVSASPSRFTEGDEVEVLRACRLPRAEEVIGDGMIVKITGTPEEPLYWVSGFLAARSGRQLRLLRRPR